MKENLPQPDPAWEYYLLWHRLLKAQSKLDQLIKFVSDTEQPNPESDRAVDEDLLALTAFLEETRLTE